MKSLWQLFFYGLLLLHVGVFAMDFESMRNQLSETKKFKIFGAVSGAETKVLEDMDIASGPIQREYPFGTSCDPQHFEAFLSVVKNDPQAKRNVASILGSLCTNLSKVSHGATIGKGVLVVENAHTDAFNGWHIDFPSKACHPKKPSIYDGYEYHRIIVNLRGEGTIFAQLNPQQNTKFLHCFCKDPRTKIGEEIISPKSWRQLQPGQGALFSVENAVHRRPVTTNARVFMVFDVYSPKNSSAATSEI